MGSKSKLDYAGRFDPDQLATYLEAIAEGLRRERVRIAAGGRSIVLQPRGIIRLELSAETDPEKGRSSFEMELSWREAEVVSAPELLISTAEAEEEQEERENPAREDDVPLTVDQGF